MSDCSFCQRSNYRIHEETLRNCLKNRVGSCPACAKLQALDHKISEARRALQRLLDEREGLASTLNEQHDPLARQLPVELISRIFDHSLPFPPSLYVFDSGFDEEQHITSVFKLGQICRNWRNIAQRTPELWAIFSLTLTSTNCVSSIQVADEWLGRAGELSLFVRLNTYELEEISQVASSAAKRVISSITSRAQRCKMLSLDLPPDIVRLFSSASFKQHFRQLGHLTVLRLVGDGEEGFALKLSASPHILTLEDGYLPQVSIDWSGLTHFTFIATSQCILATEIMFLLQNANYLPFCSLQEVDGGDSPGVDMPIIHTSLQTLHVGPIHAEADVWGLLAFPTLTTLHLTACRGKPTWLSVTNMLHRSGCNVTDLKVMMCDEDTQDVDDFMALLKATPDLERLSIGGDIWEGSLLSQMDAAASSISPPFLSRLRYLSFSQFRSFDLESLIQFLITMTSKTERTLRSVEVRWLLRPLEDGRRPMMDKDKLKQLMDAAQGLELRVVDADGSDLVTPSS